MKQWPIRVFSMDEKNNVGPLDLRMGIECLLCGSRGAVLVDETTESVTCSLDCQCEDTQEAINQAMGDNLAFMKMPEEDVAVLVIVGLIEEALGLRPRTEPYQGGAEKGGRS